jgi:hypothetical protein
MEIFGSVIDRMNMKLGGKFMLLAYFIGQGEIENSLLRG